MRASQAAAPVPDPIVADLQRRVEQLETIVAGLARRHAPVDSADDARLLSAIAFTFGSATFCAVDLLAAGGDVQPLVRGLDGPSLGRWLRSIARRPSTGLTLHRIKRLNTGQFWEVR
jgi:hypothetical protein